MRKLSSLYFITFRFLFTIFLMLQFHVTFAAAQTYDFSNALISVPAGGVLSLPPGNWGALNMRGSGPSVIRSVDPSNPAIFSRMQLENVKDLKLENISLKYDWSKEDLIRFQPFEIKKSQDIVLSGLRITGDVAREGSATSRGFPWAFGLSIRSSQNITLENSEISRFFRGLVASRSKQISIINNDFHSLRMDGLNFAAAQGVRIIGNHIHDFDRSMESKDHSDMIQFWTNKTNTPNTDIVIRDNILNSGEGGHTQSIFMRNEEVDQGRAGSEMFYRDILIEGNVIINAHLHGITLGESDNVTIRGNTVVHNRKSAGERPTRDLWLPQIRVSDASKNVTIEGNIAARIPEQRLGWRVSNNLEVQPHARMEPGFYGQVFAPTPRNDPADAASYVPQSGGPADRPGLGAPRLQAR